MDEKPIELIRETRRHQLFLNRKKHKDEESDIRRPLANLRISQSDVITIVNKLKTKSSISVTELKTLQNSIVDNMNNIELVFNTHGALRGLVRELSGNDVNKQCAACGCLCNLALADCKACCVIARAAGAYLIAALDSLTAHLAENCAWTLGNLFASGPKCSEILLALGCSKLCAVTGDVANAAVYALAHLAYVLGDSLKPELLSKMIQFLSKTDINTESMQLLFILSCHKDFSQNAIPDNYLQKIFETIPESIKKHLNICKTLGSKDTKCCELIYVLRVLANINSEKFYNHLLCYFLENNLVDNFKLLLREEDKSVLWFLGNILNMCGESDFFHQLIM